MLYFDCNSNNEIELYWDEDGVRYEIDHNDGSDEYYNKVQDIYLPALQKRYGVDAVKFENPVGRHPRLNIKFSDTPHTWLLTATPKEITEFACKLNTDAWDLSWQMESSAEKLFEQESAVM